MKTLRLYGAGLLVALLLALAACSTSGGGSGGGGGGGGGGGSGSPDFTLSLNPASLNIQQGSSGTTQLTITPQNGFTGTVSLSLVGAPSGVTLSPTSMSVTGSGPVTQDLTLSVGSGVATGTYDLQVRATSGSLTKTTSLSLTVIPPPNFTLSLNPTSLTVQQGGSGTTQLTITPQNGFTGTVSLSLVAEQDQVPQGLTLSPGSVQVSGSGPVNQSLTLSAQSTTPTGTYRLKVRATSGSLTRETNLTVEVTPPPPSPGFTLSDPTPNPLSVQAGGTATFQVTLTSQNGFQGEVSLSLASGQDPLPQGLSITATSPSPINLQAGGSVNVTATVGANAQVAPGTYRLKVRATSGSLTREVGLTVVVTAPPPPPDFTLSLNPTSLTVQQGGSGTTQLTITPQSGFTGTVSLSLVDGSGNPVSGISLSPTSVSVTGSSPLTVNLTVNVAGSVAPGTYSLQVRATSGSLTREADLSLTAMAAPNFTLSLNPTSLTVQQGSNGQTTLTVTPQNGFTGTVGLSLVAGQDQVPQDLTLSPNEVRVSGTNPVNQTLSFSAQPTTPTGTYRLKVRATSGSLTREADLTVVVTAPPPPPDFTISLNPASLTVQQGSSGTTTLTVTPQNGFTGTASLSLVGAPSGVSLSPTSVTVSGSSPVNQTLTVSVGNSVATGTYSLQVRATSGSLTKTTGLSLTVTAPATDFSMVLESNTLTLAPGGTAYVRLSVTGSGGTLSLSLVDSNNNPFSYVSLSPTTTPIPSAPMLELSASPSLAPGTYPLKVQGTSNGVTKEAPLTLEVRTSSTANLRILKAEWGQTVLKENLRLVAGKEALLRVHLVAAPSALSLSQPLAGAVYQGSAFVGNLSFTCPNPIPTSTVQGDLATTCNATLPGNWVAPGLRVELRADPNNQVAETDESDNALTLSPPVGAGTILHLTVVPVVHQGQTASIPNFAQTLWRIWPLQSIASNTRAPYTFSGTLGPRDGQAWSQLLDELRILRQTDGSGRYYYGFVRVSYTSGIAGIGYIGYPVAAGWDYASSAPAVMAHELGHNFGRDHAPCGVSGDPNYPYPNGSIGTWGYDLASGTLKDPNQYYDLMSYCSPQWVSDYNYEAVQSFLESTPPRPQSFPGEGLLFSGRIRGDEVVFNPPLRLAVAPEGKPSPYRLRADGVESPVYVLEDSEGTLHFQAKLPLGSWSWLALYRDGVLLKEVVAPFRPQAEPKVDLKEVGGFVEVRWTGYPYLSLAHLAVDGGRTTLGLFAQGGEARFAIQGLPRGGQFEVQLSDGLNVQVLLFPR